MLSLLECICEGDDAITQLRNLFFLPQSTIPEGRLHRRCQEKELAKFNYQSAQKYFEFTDSQLAMSAISQFFERYYGLRATAPRLASYPDQDNLRRNK